MEEELAYPTNKILLIDLFMALAIITVKIRPLAPTRDPATIRTLFSNNNPAKAAAMPEKEFNKEITTAQAMARECMNSGYTMCGY